MRSFLSVFVVVVISLALGVVASSCGKGLHSETQTMMQEMGDSLAPMMQIRDNGEFFRKYIAYNVRFTLRHKIALQDTAIMNELRRETKKTAIFQEAQRRIDAVQSNLP